VVRMYVDIFNVLGRENVIDYRYGVTNGPGGQLVTTRTRGDTLFPFLPGAGVVWDF
jgi:hypothetical protein